MTKKTNSIHLPRYLKTGICGTKRVMEGLCGYLWAAYEKPMGKKIQSHIETSHNFFFAAPGKTLQQEALCVLTKDKRRRSRSEEAHKAAVSIGC